MTRHLLDITDLSLDELRLVLSLSKREQLPRVLDGLGAALIFEKPSNRTRHSMEMAVVQLGGHPVYTRGEEVGFDVREPVEDITRVMAGYHGVLAARVFEHSVVERMAAVSTVPVVNMLSDVSHPLQAVADVLAMEEVHGSLAGHRVAFVGDWNNVSRSLAEACVMLGAEVSLGCPHPYDATADELGRIGSLGAGSIVEAGVDDVRIYGANCTPPLIGDLDGNLRVNGADLGILLGAWGTLTYDLDHDGGPVAGGDLGVLLGNWTAN